MATITAGAVGLDMRLDFLPDIGASTDVSQSSTEVVVTGHFSGLVYTFDGVNFSGDDGTGFPTAGTIHSLTITTATSELRASITGANLDVVQFGNYEASDNFARLSHALFRHADTLTGSAANDYLTGFSGNDDLYGLDGVDVLKGNHGNDNLYGGDGRDTLHGGPGDDTLEGGNGRDTAAYTQSPSGVTVDLSIVGQQDTGSRGLDTLISIENLTGGHGGDVFIDDSGNNVLKGRGGDDLLEAYNGGKDVLLAGDGDDSIFMKGNLAAADKIDGGSGNDRVQLFGDYTGAHAVVFDATTMVNVETLQLLNHGLGFPHLSYDLTSDDATVGSGATLTVDASVGGPNNSPVSFNGSAETDGSFVFIGNTGGDTFVGGAQGDSIRGGVGADHATGGGGADTFVYSSAHDSAGDFWGYDVIQAFDASADRLDVTTGVTTLNSASGAVDDSDFDGTLGTAIGGSLVANGAVLVTASGSDLSGHVYVVVDGDGNATYNAGADYVIEITGYSGTLAVGNFI